MKPTTPVRLLAATALLGGIFATSAMADPDATIHFGGGSVALIGSIQWGGGHLMFQGRDVPVKVSGIGIGAVGIDHFSAEGEVYHLRDVHDINGTYTALNTNATAGAGEGWIDMQNEHGVEIRAHTTQAGLSLSLAPTGMRIHTE